MDLNLFEFKYFNIINQLRFGIVHQRKNESFRQCWAMPTTKKSGVANGVRYEQSDLISQRINTNSLLTTNN
jgi:hypothetical protein